MAWTDLLAHNNSKNRCKRRKQWDCWVCLPTADLHPIHALAPSSKLILGAAAKSHKTVSSTFILLPALIGLLIEQNADFHRKMSRSLCTRGQVAIFRSLVLGGDKLSSKAQTTMSLTILQALNNLSKCKVTMLTVRYQGGNDTKQRSIHDKSKNVCTLESPLTWGPENESLNSWHS